MDARLQKRNRVTATPSTDIELGFVNTFIVRAKRERYAMFVSSPRRRRTFLQALYSFSDFDPRFIVPDSGTNDWLVAELRRRGAGTDCYVISADPELDGTTMPLEQAVADIVDLKDATIIVCIPSRLAYFQGEDSHHFILDSRAQGGAR
jgi:hypothetical protein